MSDAAPDRPDEQALVDWLTERVAGYLRHEVPEDAPLTECGLDSVALFILYGDIERELCPRMDPVDFWAHPTIRELARYLLLRDRWARQDGRVRAAFVFAGQGCQHPRMTAGLYDDSTGYRHHLNEAAEAIRPHLGMSVTELILRGDPRVHQTALTQPMLFAVEYALAMALMEEGVSPVAVLGHGVGEFAAATVAGALSLADAAQLVSFRGAFMQALPSGGGMMAVCADPYEAAEAAAWEPGVFIGAVNAARATVLSGELAGLERAQERLEAAGIACMALAVAHAFHSPLMEAVTARFQAAARHVPCAAPRIPYYSTVYGRELRQPLDAPYWTEQITSPVRFADAARRLLARQAPTQVVEIGPKVVLTPFLRRMAGARGPRCVPVCRGPESDAVDLAGVLSELNAGPLAEELGDGCG